MKKRMRALMCFVFAVLMIGCAALPAMAASNSVRVPYEMYTSNCTVTCNETNGIATISITPTASYVKAYAQNSLYNSLNNVYGVSVEVESISFGSAIAIADNILINDSCGCSYESEITKTTGRFYIGEENIRPGLSVYPD